VPKVGTKVHAATISLRISQLVLHCCNTCDAIEDEKRLPLRGSLVFRIAEDQDKFDKQGAGV
jgi:hypothetical protein